MEDQIGLVRGHGPAQRAQVFDIAHQTHQGQVREALAQVLLGLVEGELAELEQDETAGAKAGNLAAQLGADRAARTGHHHGAAADQAGDGVFVELHRLTAQHVFGLDVAHAVDAGAAFAQLIGRGHGHHGQAGGRRQRQHALALLLGGRRHRQDQVGHVGQIGPVGQQVESAPDRDACDAAAMLAGVVIEQADHGPAAVLDAGNQQLGRGAGAQHQSALAVGLRAGAPGPRGLAEHAHGHARQRQADQGEDGVQGQHGTGHLGELRHQDDDRARQTGAQAHPGQARDVVEAGVAPAGAGHAQGPGGRAVDRDHAQQHGPVIAGTLVQPALHPHAEQVGEVPRQQDEEGIGQHDHALTAGAQLIQNAVQGVPEHDGAKRDGRKSGNPTLCLPRTTMRG